MSPFVTFMAWIVSGLLPACGQTLNRMKSPFSCVSFVHPIMSLRLKWLDEAFASQGPKTAKTMVWINWEIDSELIGVDLVRPFSREVQFLVRLQNLKSQWDRPTLSCSITSLRGWAWQRLGTKTFHAWLPKIITFSAYVVGKEKKINFLPWKTICVYSIDRHYLSIYLKLSLPKAGSSIVID